MKKIAVKLSENQKDLKDLSRRPSHRVVPDRSSADALDAFHSKFKQDLPRKA